MSLDVHTTSALSVSLISRIIERGASRRVLLGPYACIYRFKKFRSVPFRSNSIRSKAHPGKLDDVIIIIVC